MPRIAVRPLIDLTKAQWKTVLRRVMEHEEQTTGTRALSKQSGEMILNRFEPPVERKVGALYRNVDIGGEKNYPTGEVERRVERLPIEEARAKYFANPREFSNPTAWSAPAKEIRQVPSGSPDELAEGLAYERVKQIPLLTPRTARTHSVMKQTMQGEVDEAALAQSGGQQLPGMTPGQTLAQQGLSAPTVDPELAELMQLQMKAEGIWKTMGGGRSMGAKLWEKLRSVSRQKSSIKTAYDYFISSYVRWNQDPAKFNRAYPREANLLTQLKQQFDAPPAVPPVMGGGQ